MKKLILLIILIVAAVIVFGQERVTYIGTEPGVGSVLNESFTDSYKPGASSTGEDSLSVFTISWVRHGKVEYLDYGSYYYDYHGDRIRPIVVMCIPEPGDKPVVASKEIFSGEINKTYNDYVNDIDLISINYGGTGNSYIFRDDWRALILTSINYPRNEDYNRYYLHYIVFIKLIDNRYERRATYKINKNIVKINRKENIVEFLNINGDIELTMEIFPNTCKKI